MSGWVSEGVSECGYVYVCMCVPLCVRASEDL